MDVLIKEKRSKLAPFEESHFTLPAPRSTLAEMQAWIARHGVTVSTGPLTHQNPA
jgi:hypothetical protein